MVEREFFIDNLLVRIHRCFWCTGLAPREFDSPFPGSLISTLLGCDRMERENTSKVGRLTARGSHPPLREEENSFNRQVHLNPTFVARRGGGDVEVTPEPYTLKLKE